MNNILKNIQEKDKTHDNFQNLKKSLNAISEETISNHKDITLIDRDTDVRAIILLGAILMKWRKHQRLEKHICHQLRNSKETILSSL
jgi:hypothetical protein